MGKKTVSRLITGAHPQLTKPTTFPYQTPPSAPVLALHLKLTLTHIITLSHVVGGPGRRGSFVDRATERSRRCPKTPRLPPLAALKGRNRLRLRPGKLFVTL